MISIKQAIDEQSRSEERRKIKLENKFAPVIRRMFNRMAKDFEDLFIATGNIINFQNYLDDWRGALKQHYFKVGKEFLTNARKSEFVRDLLLKQDEDATVEQIATIGAAYTIFSTDRSGTQSSFIVDTSNKDAIEAVDEARNKLRGDDVFREPTNEEVAEASSKILRKKFKSRVFAIANMETQAPAESAKLIEAAVLSGFPVLPFQQVDEAPITTNKTWATVGDEKVRLAHSEADGQMVPIEGVFTVDRELLRFPGDTSLGASIGNTINCLHPDSIVDANNVKALTRRYYKGPMIRIKMPDSDDLTVTPNHPILTVDGWVFAKKINKRSRILGCIDRNFSKKDINIQNVKSTIEEEFNAFHIFGVFTVRMGSVVVDFHGEGSDQDVDIIRPDSLLWNIGDTHIGDKFRKELFVFADFGSGKLFSDCLLDSALVKKIRSFISDSSICIFSEVLSIFKSGLRHSVKHSLRSVPRFYTSGIKSVLDCGTAIFGSFVNSLNRKTLLVVRKYFFENIFKLNFIKPVVGLGNSSHFPMTGNGLSTFINRDTKFSRTGFQGSSGRIEIMNIDSIDHIEYSGYVYNLETESNIYVAQGMINHNCRCAAIFRKR